MITFWWWCIEVVRELRRADEYRANAPCGYVLTAKALRALDERERTRWN